MMRYTAPPEPGSSLLPFDRKRNARSEALARLSEPTELADYLRTERETLLRRIREHAHSDREDSADAAFGLATAREFSDLMDALVTRMFELACHRSSIAPASLSIAIVATGGYGRRELCPFSDIDITFIPRRDGDPQIDRVIRDMFTQVMDICIARCGLEVGYAYRLLEDCTSLDHQTASGLLDARLVVGSSRLFIQFEDAYWSGFNATDFIFTKLNERERSLMKWGRIPRVVEPQLKEGPGGLRDLQSALWVVQARHHLAAARVRGERAWETLVRDADLTPAEVTQLAEAKEFLFRVRNALHAVTGAERDTLVVTRQEEVAEVLGYGKVEPFFAAVLTTGNDVPPLPDDTLLPYSAPDHTPPPVERFMADLYPALALVRNLASRLLCRIENSRLMLGIGLDCRRRQIVPANDALQSDDPGWLLWACELAQKYDLALSEDVERVAAALVDIQPILTDPIQAADVFTRILSSSGKVYSLMQKMADIGILGWYLPEFGTLMDLIPYEASHDFTVGQHSLLLIQHLEALLAETGEEKAEMRRVLEELPNPEQLFLAALLHDAGKAIPGRPHSIVSEEITARVCARLGWPEEACANVLFLVRQHLLMAETAHLRDLQQDETIRDFTREVTDLDRLNMLYLLTYADMRAVGEGIWTPVKGRFLRDLWRRAAAVLNEEEPAEYDDAALARTRRRLQKDLSLENLPEAEVTEHVEAMPPNYLLNHSLHQIGIHIGFIRRVRDGHPVVDFHDERGATHTELTVCALDDPQPGLLAKIAGILYAADLNVHSAQVNTRVTGKDRIALDILWIDFRGRQLTPGKRREVAANLNAVLTGAQSVQDILNKKRASGLIKPEAHRAFQPTQLVVRSIRNDLSDTLTVVETGGPDIKGAFYRASEAFSRLGWDIRSARVTTWKGEARANFYVAEARNLSEAEARNALAHVLPVLEPEQSQPRS